MKLLKAHINNFGKLHDVDFDFSDTMNSFIHENGWGKTTLSVFIKSMLYGMEYTTSKDLEKNEKLKYSPWQGGNYGGSLSFSINGKEYSIYRQFGLKKNEDVFELRDIKTNKISTDFSENLGTELFGINRETYARSVYVVLNESPTGSDDISAKLNNLIEANDDVGNFNKAYETLEKKANTLKPKQKNKGEIFQAQETIDKDHEVLQEIEAKISQNESYEKQISEIKQEILLFQKEQEKITNQVSESAKYENKIRYEQLQKDLEDVENSKKEVLSFFNENVPDTEILKKIDSVASSFTTVESNIKNASMTQAEKDNYESLKNYFAGDIPSKDKIDSCIKTDSEYKQFKQQEGEKKLSTAETEEYNKLCQKFGDNEITEADINNCVSAVTDVQNAKNEIVKLESDVQTKKTEVKIEEQNKPKNIKRIIFLSISGVCLIASVLLFILKLNLIFSIVGLSLTIVFVILGLISKARTVNLSDKKTEISELENKIDIQKKENEKKENEYKYFISKYCAESISELAALNKIGIDFNRYSTLLAKTKQYDLWLKEQSKTQEDYETSLKMFVKRFCKTEDISNVPAEIQTLNEKLSRLSELEKKINNDSENKQKQSEDKEKLESILSQYRIEKSLDFKEQVQQVHNKINDIKNIDELIKTNQKRLFEFENNPENDIESFANLVKPEKSVDELRAELSKLSEQITDKNAVIATYQKIIDDNLTYTEKKDDIETEIERLTIEKKEKTEEHKMLLKTLELLEKAKNNLDANYSDPMKEGFSKYIEMLDDGKLNLNIDTSLNVFIDANGKKYDSEFLSDGYKDMVNFCSRLALVDALFKDVKPPIILDDPFVNLDDDKVPRALKLIKEMAKEKQILYFACHKSREIS